MPKKRFMLSALILLIFSTSILMGNNQRPIIIKEQGNFSVGGTVIKNPGGI